MCSQLITEVVGTPTQNKIKGRTKATEPAVNRASTGANSPPDSHVGLGGRLIAPLEATNGDQLSHY